MAAGSGTFSQQKDEAVSPKYPIMRQCLTCNLVLENRQTYLDHIKPGSLLQCKVCALISENECEHELHRLSAHSRANFEENRPKPEEAVSEADYTRFLPPDKFIVMTAEENPDVLAAQPRLRVEDQVIINEFIGDDPFGNNPPDTSKKGVPMAILGAPQADLLLDLVSDSAPEQVPKSDPTSLKQAIIQFQNLVKERAAARGGSSTMAKVNTKVELKKRIPIVASDSSTGTFHSARATPERPQAAEKATRDARQGTESKPEPTEAIQMGITCFECGENFSNILALQQHQMISKHNYCEWCFAFFADRTILQKHKDKMHNFKCAGCHFTHFTLEDLQAHQRMKDHCYCKVCNSYFVDLRHHTQHMAALHDNSRHGSTNKPGPSAIVPGAASAPRPANTSGAATTARRYACTAEKCTFIGDMPVQLRSHQQRMNHNFCKPCGKAFCDIGALRNHRKGGGRHQQIVEKLKESQA